MPDFTFDLDDINLITTGAIGRPGSRTFFLQIHKGITLITLQIEKEQVLALGRGIDQLMKDIAQKFPERKTTLIANPEADTMVLEEPMEPVFRVGQQALGYDEERDRLILVIQEMVIEEEEADPLIKREPKEPSTARFSGTREQFLALARHGEAVSAAGRKMCPKCGEPMEPSGHVCSTLRGGYTFSTPISLN